MKLFSKFMNLKYKSLILAFVISLSTYLIFFGKFLLPDFYFWGSDAQIEYVPARVYLFDKIFKEQTFPFWTEKLFSGFPIYADAENGYLNPINVLSILIFGPLLSYKILHFGFYLIGSLSLYYFLKRKNINLFGFILANLIFYFNVFMIDHQIHFNIILTFYLFPTSILLADLYLEKPALKYIVLQSLIISFSILYGHIQSSVIFSVGVALFFVIFAGKKLFKVSTIIYGVMLLLAILIQTLPQVLPSKELFDTSIRGSKLNLYQGSMYPNMFSFVFVPYVFGEIKDYIGKEIHYSYTYTEIYMYLGITSFIVFIFGLIFNKFSRITIYAYSLLWIFLIFFTIRYNNFFDQETPVISSFRHWERTFVLFSFGVSLVVANFVSSLSDLKFKYSYFKILLLAPPIYYLWYYHKLVPNSVAFKKLNDLFSITSITMHKDFETLKFLVIFSFVLILLTLINSHLKNKKLSISLQILFIVLIGYDLFYFSKDVTQFRLKNIKEYKLIEFDSPKNERTLHYKLPIFGMETMYLNSWSPMGYSQFIEKEYASYAKRYGLNELNTMNEYQKIPVSNFLQALGITNVNFVDERGVIQNKRISTLPIDLIQNTNISGEYLKKNEGDIQLKINSKDEQNVNTYIKYNPNWEIKINNKLVNYEKRDIFLRFRIPAGESIVEFKYIPKAFYLGLRISSALLVVFGIFSYLLKKYKMLN